MIRLWLTVEDLARTRIAGPDPFAETVLSVLGPAAGIEEGLDNLLGAPRPVLDAEIDWFGNAHGSIPDGLRSLLAADSGAPRTLAHALRGYHDTAVAPYWPGIRARLERERERAI